MKKILVDIKSKLSEENMLLVDNIKLLDNDTLIETFGETKDKWIPLTGSRVRDGLSYLGEKLATKILSDEKFLNDTIVKIIVSFLDNTFIKEHATIEEKEKKRNIGFQATSGFDESCHERYDKIQKYLNMFNIVLAKRLKAHDRCKSKNLKSKYLWNVRNGTNFFIELLYNNLIADNLERQRLVLDNKKNIVYNIEEDSIYF